MKRNARHLEPERLAAQSAPPEPIAIIGIGCRYPGASNPEELWRVLMEGRETVGPYPGGRFEDLDALYAEAPRKSGHIQTDRSGFLKDVAGFDPQCFEISPLEAVYIDPQQRLLLEVAWEALEDAGQLRENYEGSSTGVYMSLWTSEYQSRLYESVGDADFYSVVGCGRFSASGRISFAFGLQGPSLTVDTACSSSLVAAYLACQALRSGEIEMALAGGVNLILGTEKTELLAQAKILSADASCKFGDASANGYVRSEGAGIVVLKRLSRAMADRDRIYGVIRGGAVNNDGRSGGLMVRPSQAGHREMLRLAWKSAAVDPRDFRYIEMHGTGTGAGDPVEIGAVGMALAEAGVKENCPLGSIKTNIGHTETASGAAGLIKAALVLQHRMVPASLHFTTPNPNIPWQAIPIRIATEPVDLSKELDPLLVGVNSFGITGTNAHLVLEEAERRPVNRDRGSGPYMLPISAHTREALEELRRSYLTQFEESSAGSPIRDICYTAGARRDHREFRSAIVGASSEELQANLAATVAGENCEYAVSGRAGKSKVVFVAPGQGSQWPAMARELYDSDPAFRQAFDLCDAAIQAEMGWRLKDRILSDEAERWLKEIDTIQPALFVMSVSLAAVWRSWGIEPDAVVGHSMGEVAAAHIAGVLNLEDAVRVICRRSRLMKTIRSAGGGMAAIEMPLEEVEKLLASQSRLSVAASNGPSATVISGDSHALEALLEELAAREIYCRAIKVDVASHSAQVDPILKPLLDELSTISPQPARIPMLSTVTGEFADSEECAGVTLDAQYWAENLRRPVQFAPAIERLVGEGHGIFVELSPHPILLPSIEASAQAAVRKNAAGEKADALHEPPIVVASLRREKPARATLLLGLGTLYAGGLRIQWDRLYPGGANLVRLPQYPFQRKRYWPRPADPSHSRFARRRFGRNPLVEPGSDSSRLTPESADSAESLYTIEWTEDTMESRERAEITVTLAAKASRENWLVFADVAGVSVEIKRLVEGVGGRCTLVQPGSGFERLGEREFQVDVTSRVDLDRLFEQVELSSGIPTAVLHLWSLDARGSEERNATSLLRAQALGSQHVPFVIQAIATRNWADPPRLWLVTAGAVAITGDAGDPAIEAAPMWGIGSVAAREHAELRPSLVDLSAAPSSSDARALVLEVCRADVEDRIALRGEQRYLARVAHLVTASSTGAANSPATGKPLFARNATYLITGGLGAIALTVAEWMSQNGAGQIALLSRRPPSAEAWQAIEQIRGHGAAVVNFTADIANEAELAGALAAVRAMGLPIRGVMHAAAATDDALMLDLTPERFSPAFSSKIAGAWNLDRTTLEDDLDFFILFSSISAVHPQPGMGSYAAANAFLDAFAYYRRAQDRTASSVNWGGWGRLGLARTAGTGRNLEDYEQQGLKVYTVPEALNALHRVLETNPAQVIAVSFDWQKFGQYYGDSQVPPAFSNLVARAKSDGAVLKPSEILARLGATQQREERREILESYLQETLGRVLKLAAAKIDRERPLGTMGLDSLMGLELVRRLSQSLEIAVPATVVFNYPTIRLLSGHLLGRLHLDSDAQAESEKSSAPTAAENGASRSDGLLSALSEVSDEEALEALIGKSEVATESRA